MAIDMTDTKCIWCALSCVNQCSWANEQEPVEGWVAEKNPRGYSVIECPLFIKDTIETIKPTKLHDRGTMNLLEALVTQMSQDYVTGHGPYDDYNNARKRELRKSKAEIRGMNRKAIEKWLYGPIAGKLLQLSDTDEVVRGLRKMSRQYETEMMNLMR